MFIGLFNMALWLPLLIHLQRVKDKKFLNVFDFAISS